MKTSLVRALGLAAVSALVLSTLGCPPSSGGSGRATVSEVSPPEGAAAGGLVVLVSGSNFESGPASVYFDGVKATEVEVLSDSQIRCTTPPGVVGVANVEVRSAGNTGKKVAGFEYLPGVESKEAANASGGNDDFGAYEDFPIEFDYQGYIGELGDVDVVHMHPPDGGKVFVTLNWTASFTSGGIAAMQVEFFQGPDPSPEPDAFFGGSIIGSSDGSGPPPEIVDWMRPSFVVAGAHGPYLRVTAYGDGNHAGFDPVRPYTLRVDYEPDATFEAFPQADSFRLATPIDPASAPVQVTNGAAYDDDFDWYRFVAPADGWARVVVSAEGLGTLATNGEIAVSAKLFWVDPSDPDGNHVYAVPGGQVEAIDAPGPTARVFEVTSLEALSTYVIRLTNTDNVALSPYDYTLAVEYGAGGLEDDEPGTLPPANTEEDAFDLGVIASGVPSVSTGYVFHEGDDDWFKFTAPAGGGTVDITWDHSAISSAATGIGHYDASTNPLGGDFGLLVFDQAWFDAAGLPIVSETVGGVAFDTATGTDSKTVSVPLVADQNYYVYLNALRGWETGETYTLTLTLP